MDEQADERSDTMNLKFSDTITSSSRQFLHSYQKRTLNYDEQKPAEQADTLRFCMVQHKLLDLGLHVDMENSKTSFQQNFALQHMLQTLEVHYSKLMDSKERLNSYAAPALSLSKNFKNDSEKWKCTLDMAKLMDKVKKTNVEDQTYVSDKEYLKLLILMKENEPFEAPKITIPKVKEENITKDSVSATFNIIDENLFDNIDSKYSSKDEGDNIRSFANIKQKVDFQENTRNIKITKDSELFGPNFGNGCNSTVYVKNHISTSCIGSGFGQNNFQGRRNEEKSTRKSCRQYPWENINNHDKEEAELPKQNFFKTASEQLTLNNFKKFGTRQSGQPEHAAANLYGNQKRSLGARRGISSKFTPPIRRDEDRYDETNNINRHGLPHRTTDGQTKEENPYEVLMMDERMKNIDVKMVELIMNEIMDNGLSVTWDDIAGLKLAKSTIQEIVVWPMLRPDIFTGLRGPPKGLLLFGPPGTGKTMIGKCIASQSQSTFFSISASSLTSKWVGEGEKMVRAMFAVAKCHQPAVIFIDEIDSLLTQRSESEHESSRRLKTEFLVQLDGATSEDDERLLVVGATNRPQELDEAARRRLVKRLYIPLPESKARQQIIINLLTDQKHTLTSSDIEEVCEKAEGYSGADMANLCREAALGPIRSLNFVNIQQISVDEVRPIVKQDFLSALDTIRASVSKEDLHLYEDWNRKYGINPK